MLAANPARHHAMHLTGHGLVNFVAGQGKLAHGAQYTSIAGWHWHNQIMKIAPLLVLLFALSAQAATLEGRIVGITDGDTVTLLDHSQVQHKIRLAGIDAPEKHQNFGNRAKESLSELVYDKVVTVETDKKDRYGRDVGKVLIQGVDASLAQVQRGFAWHYKAYQREQSANDRKLYDFAENDARNGQRGLWRDPYPVAPWEFRRAKRGK